jgi:hypothetical protein
MFLFDCWLLHLILDLDLQRRLPSLRYTKSLLGSAAAQVVNYWLPGEAARVE